MLYGCEIEGTQPQDNWEIFYRKFNLKILYFRPSTPSCMVYGEVGKLPLQVTTSSMCRMYKLFNKQLNFEDYLLSCNNRERISLTKYRCANSKIPVYNQIYMYETELCTLCDLNVNGDEYHYIMICPYFRQSRELYLKHCLYTRPNMLKFSQLFSSENKRTLSRLAKLITVIMMQF